MIKILAGCYIYLVCAVVLMRAAYKNGKEE